MFNSYNILYRFRDRVDPSCNFSKEPDVFMAVHIRFWMMSDALSAICPIYTLSFSRYSNKFSRIHIFEFSHLK